MSSTSDSVSRIPDTTDLPAGVDHIPERLEVLRNALGLSVKDFWRRATADGGFDGSYAAAATYHRPNGPLSLEYLFATEQAFEVWFPWLSHGEGPMTKEEERAAKDPLTAAALDGLRETMPLRSHLTYEWRHLSAVASKLAQSPRFSGGGSPAAENRHLEAGRLVGECIGKPLAMLGVQLGTEETYTAQMFVSAMGHAIETIAHCATVKAADVDDTTEEEVDDV